MNEIFGSLMKSNNGNLVACEDNATVTIIRTMEWLNDLDSFY